MRKSLFIFIIICNSFHSIAQNNIDSLRLLYQGSTSSRSKAESALALVKAYMNSNLDSSNYYGHITLEHALKSGYDSLMAVAYHNLGNVAIYQGNLDGALENYIEATKQFSEERYPAISQGLMNNMGIIFDRKEEYEKAREYYIKAESFLDKLQGVMEEELRLLRQSKMYSNIGATYESQGHTNEAMGYYVKSLGIANEINNVQLQADIKRQQAIVYSNIGSLYLHEGKLNLSETNYLEALMIYENIEDNSGIARIKMHVGELYIEQGYDEKAVEAFRMSIAIGEETKNAATVYYSSERLYMLLADQGDFEGAFNEFVRYKILNDSLFNVEKAAALERMEVEYLFQEEKRILEEEQRIKTIWNYALGGSIILLIIIFLLIYRTLINKAKITKLGTANLKLTNRHLFLEKSILKEKLEFKNKELATNVMYLMKKNEFINSVSQKLISLRGSFKKENQSYINKITVDLQNEIDKDIWEEFETHFNQVHIEFYKNLSKAHADLSVNERKLCAFIKLNLSTKEISSITHQSPNSLQVARVRLRKKFGIDNNEEKLISYLEKF